MVPTYMVMDYFSSIYTDSTWHSGRKPPSREALQSAAFYLSTDLVGRVLVLEAVGRCALWLASWSLRALSSQALILLGGARLIARRLRRSFLGKCPRWPRHFWSRRACLRYCAEPGPTQKSLVPHSSGCWDVWQIPIASKLPDSVGRTFLTVV